MENFDIRIEIKQPSPRQLTNQSFMIDYKMLAKEAKYYKEALLRTLNDRIDFSAYPEEEFLVIKYYRNGKHKIDYSFIKNRKAKAQIRRVLDDVLPLVY